jgi:hypothetical protein
LAPEPEAITPVDDLVTDLSMDIQSPKSVPHANRVIVDGPRFLEIIGRIREELARLEQRIKSQPAGED